MELTFQRELESLINKYSLENESNTPDFILAQYMYACLNAFTRASYEREKWYGVKLDIGLKNRLLPEGYEIVKSDLVKVELPSGAPAALYPIGANSALEPSKFGTGPKAPLWA